MVQPAGEGERAVLHVEGEVVDVQAAGGHHLDGLEVLHLPVVANVDVGDGGGLANIHTGDMRDRDVGWEAPWAPTAEPPLEGRCLGARGFSLPRAAVWQHPCGVSLPLPLAAPGAFVSLPQGSWEPMGTLKPLHTQGGHRLAPWEGPAAPQLPWHCAACTKPFSRELDPTPGTARVITAGHSEPALETAQVLSRPHLRLAQHGDAASAVLGIQSVGQRIPGGGRGAVALTTH